MTDRKLDVICLGRLAVDLYAEQIGSRLEDVSTLAKYLGGSSANVATGTARQGLKSAMLARVGDEHMGRFLRETLAAEGVDVSHVITDPKRLTALVILGIKDRDTFPLIFYRENCADMAIAPEDFDAAFIASAKALAITGTHFSTPATDRTCRAAIAYARAAGTKTALDIDYRPVLWGLTGHGLGEERFVADASVSAHLQTIVPLFDLIVGTEEEIHIAGGSTDTISALRRLRELTSATFVVKRGPLGCSVFPDHIPDTLDEGITVYGVKVAVLNVLGAGDAFMSGFLRGWINGESYEQCCRYANACGAIVVSRHGCTPAMPTKVELDDYLSRAEQVPRPDLDGRLNRLHRVTTRHHKWNEVCALAFDHRSQFEDLARACGADAGRIPYLKKLIARAAEQVAEQAGLQGKAGILADGRFGEDVLEAITGRGWWIGRPVELPGSRPLEFEVGNNVGQELRRWPAEHIVKCLVFYHPDDEPPLRLQQERKVKDIYDACCNSGHELLLEVIPPDGSPTDDATQARSLQRFYDLGIYPDWWKLPPPNPTAWANIGQVIDANDPYCRGVVLLGLNAPETVLREGFDNAAGQRWCKGFAVGRSIWNEPCQAWLKGETDDEAAVAIIADNYRRVLDLWRARQAR
ncbi:MAG TPA: 5-dehydro-2-deoxygluconokinase [Candidatus Competibacter phosphatis]|nr:5-dehydro-2-deoxygluconokinase [Candidatus Competibacter phosphatis]